MKRYSVKQTNTVEENVVKKREYTEKDTKTYIRMTFAFLFLTVLMLVSFIVLFNV